MKLFKLLAAIVVAVAVAASAFPFKAQKEYCQTIPGDPTAIQFIRDLQKHSIAPDLEPLWFYGTTTSGVRHYYAANQTTGKTYYATGGPSSAYAVTPIVYDFVFYTALDNVVYAISTSGLLWKQTLVSNVTALAASSSQVYAAVGKGYIFALSTVSGSINWAASLEMPSSDADIKLLHAQDDYVFAAGVSLVGLAAASGEVAWSRNFSQGIRPLVSPVSTSTKFIAQINAEIAAFNVKTGALLWSQPVTSAFWGLYLRDDIVYLQGMSTLYGYQVSNGVLVADIVRASTRPYPFFTPAFSSSNQAFLEVSSGPSVTGFNVSANGATFFKTPPFTSSTLIGVTTVNTLGPYGFITAEHQGTTAQLCGYQTKRVQREAELYNCSTDVCSSCTTQFVKFGCHEDTNTFYACTDDNMILRATTYASAHCTGTVLHTQSLIKDVCSVVGQRSEKLISCAADPTV